MYADQQGNASAPRQLVERFLDDLVRGDFDGAAQLLSEDIEYANAGLPTVHGRDRVRWILRAALAAPGGRFEVHLHAIATNGPSVLSERTDVLEFGRLRIQFWVCGRFDVHDGQIVLWRDYFDHLSFFAAALRGLLGTVFAAARPRPPTLAQRP